MTSGASTTILTLTATYITVAGLLFVSAPDSLSRRVSRGLPRSRALRVLWAPFLPGGARGLLYALMSLVVLGFFVTVLLPQLTLTSILNDRQTTRYAIALAAYSLIYLGAGTLLARLLRRVVQGIYSFQVLAILVLANLLLIVAAEVIHFLSRLLTTATSGSSMWSIQLADFAANDRRCCDMAPRRCRRLPQWWWSRGCRDCRPNVSACNAWGPRHCERPGPPRCRSRESRAATRGVIASIDRRETWPGSSDPRFPVLKSWVGKLRQPRLGSCCRPFEIEPSGRRVCAHRSDKESHDARWDTSRRGARSHCSWGSE